ncbi:MULTISPECIES: MMPL family transporter [Streptomyces]|uniref:MMPL domain-containing protein n=1 Tax=Streptomyces sviceus (strain ATCC 29083 / DSM 924 / JCM 4929 / NBRC 13980 / NCIMB 11184 / NRRL 5439 / UC 5370) TaxID=463191 RepID=B5I6I1_STRX2|nr:MULTISPECIES: MMPL family transporter [Streptomyces]EDY60686.1 MMPL domain-containing protein [Streptomyces sviceus ATCC 29083]MYT03830.1 MMPL family transporter [Streptomyces sp. SID5470]
MAGKLYALGRWAARRRRWVVAGWLLLLAVVGGLGITLHGNLSTQFSVPGIEAQRATDLLKKEFPEAAGADARVVFAAPPGATLLSGKEQAAIASSLHNAASVAGAISVSDPVTGQTMSADHTIGFADVQFAKAAGEVPKSATDALISAMGPARDAGLTVEYDGSAMDPTVSVSGPAEIIGIVVAFLVLALALGSLVAAGLPMVTAFVGVAIGVLGVEFVAGFVQMTETATTLALMIGLAVGIDYALFLVSRHREQLACQGDDELDVQDSIGHATATAGSAVAFAGLTVIIALAALSATGIPFLTVMGLAAAFTVLLAVLVSLTLVPAVLAFAGERLRPRAKQRRSRSARPDSAGAWGLAWARMITRRPVAALLVCLAALGTVALPVGHLRLGLPGSETQPVASTQHRGYDLLGQGLGPGYNATVTVAVDTARVPEAQRTALLDNLADTLRGDTGVAAVAPPVTNQAGTVSLLSVIPTTGPDDQATTDLVHRMRERDKQAVTQAGGVMYVTGTTATAIDVSAKLADALPLFIAIITILAIVLLTIAFRSLLVPLKAVLGFLLSTAASLGFAVWVFQDGNLTDAFGVAAAAPVVAFLPVLLVGVLFGLAMDYEVFLVSRMREHFEHTGDAREAVAHGVARSGRVVVAAALIMMVVFGGFIFTDDPVIKSIAFSLAFGVLFDAFVVRLTIVPAVMALLGHRAWWLPRWLDRVLPDVDIEGARLPAPTPTANTPATTPVRQLDHV